jgi:hypothetical protein
MDKIRELGQRKGVVIGAAAVAGLLLGVLYAWVINPVEWVDGTPENLREDYQEDYLRAAIDSYSVNRDVELAVARYQSFGEAAPTLMAAIEANPEEVNPAAIDDFAATVSLYTAEATPTPASGSARPPSSAAGLLLPVCGLTLVLGLLLAGVVLIRGRSRRKTARGADQEPGPDLEAEPYAAPYAAPSAEKPAPAARAAGLDRPPLATFRTTYTLGDDLYDDSFSIESASGDFLGECGVGIGDLIGVGDPKKVSAFEVWLFDKNDIQTVTKVMMSRYAFQDEATRNRMAAKGDPILGEPGAVVVLETASLQVEARIVDLSYGGGALPAESFFERVTIELRAASKQRGD